MSKGLGTLQRKLIEISTATQTIWQAMPDGVPFEVADIAEVTACGFTTTRKEGYTWRNSGEPWFSAKVVLRTLDEFMECKAAFRTIQTTDRCPSDSALVACWSMHHIRATLWPDLWQKGDNREDLQHPRYGYATFPQIPHHIKVGRNSAQAGLSRAIASMECRGMLAYCGYTFTDSAKSMWLSHGKLSGHITSYVLSDKILHP